MIAIKSLSIKSFVSKRKRFLIENAANVSESFLGTEGAKHSSELWQRHNSGDITTENHSLETRVSNENE